MSHGTRGQAALTIEGAACDCGVAAELMPAESAAQLSTVLKAMADPTRVRLVDYVAASPGGTVCACHLPGELGISQPTLSHHLKTLTEAGILTREQRGRWAHYTVAPHALTSLAEFLHHTIRAC